MDNTTYGAQPPKKSKRKWFALGLGVVGASVLSYFGFQYWKKNKQETPMPQDKAPTFTVEETKTVTKTNPKQAKPKTASTKTTQKKIDSTKTSQTKSNPAKPKTGTVNHSATQEKPIDFALLAQALKGSISLKKFEVAILLLNRMKTVKDYAAVNKIFNSYVINGVKQTIVNAMLNTFKTNTQKLALRLTFTKMGLKYDGKTWTLSGVETMPVLITTKATKVWKDPKTSVAVPINMVLGRELDRKKNFSLFESDNQYFLVESNHVNYYKN